MTVTEPGTDAVHRFVPEAVALQTAVMAGLSESEREELIGMLGTVSRTAAALAGDAIVAAIPRPERLSVPDDVARRPT